MLFCYLQIFGEKSLAPGIGYGKWMRELIYELTSRAL